MIDFTVPEETRLTIDGLFAFLRREVEPLEEAHRALLENPHAAYGADGSGEITWRTIAQRLLKGDLGF